MGGALSTIRWTPYGPLPDSKSKGKGGHPPSPSNSTTNLSYENHTDDEDEMFHQGNGVEHLGTSGILMGANAPPLYDACLVGRWEDVLDICGREEEGGSDASPNAETATTTTHCSSSNEGEKSDGSGGESEWPQDHRERRVSGVEALAARAAREARLEESSRSSPAEDTNSPNHPCLQTRYTDRRRNTPLHLACRRQPPPSVVRALLNHSPCEAVSRRTADGLTPLHFAAYCGAGVEVISILVDRMRSDAAVGRAMRLSSAMTLDENEAAGSKEGSRWRLPSEESMLLPPTRLLDRRQRTPLHCALSGFRTPIRPLVVRKLLAADPASATLCDERGRTPLSLLFDDYAEEIMEALEEDVPMNMVQERINKGGELHECWKMLQILLQAAYQGSVSEEERNGEGGRDNDAQDVVLNAMQAVGTIDESNPVPQDRTAAKEVNVMEMYEQEKFSMVHAAAGVCECPAPLAKLVLKCLCTNTEYGNKLPHSISAEWDNNVAEVDRSERSEGVDIEVMSSTSNLLGEEKDPIRRLDEETMRLPLHIAVCARPQCREGYSARLRLWLSSSEASQANAARPQRRPSLNSVITTNSLATHPDRGRSSSAAAGEVYNPSFGRSPSRDGIVAFSSSQRRSSTGSNHFQGYIARSSSNSSISSHMMPREPFLQHTMVRDVLNLYPAAASVVDDRTGKLPIVLAIEHGKSWETAVGPLLDAYPTPFGGGGDGGMALPDDSPKGQAHRAALQAALFLALSSPEAFVREEAIRTMGKLAKWGGVYGMPASLDGIVSEWLDAMTNHGPSSETTMLPGKSRKSTPEGIMVGPGASSSERQQGDWVLTQSSHLKAIAEVVSHSRTDSISDRVAVSCLDTSREYLFSKDGTVREAAARVLGNTLNSVGDGEDAANIMKEVVLNMQSDDGSTCGSTVSSMRGFRKLNVIVKHGRLLACSSILLTQWGGELMANQDLSEGTLAFIHACIKDKNTVVRSAAYHAAGPILGKSPLPKDPSLSSTCKMLKMMRSDILKGTRASEQVDVQLALARGLTQASRMRPDLFLCKGGMPIMDAALMLAMSSSSARPNVQKAFQIFLWVALQIGGSNLDGSERHGEDNDVVMKDGSSHGDAMSPGLEKYIELAQGENGRIMMKFVTQTLAKIENLDEKCGLLC